jgi:hypothetical protein
MKEALDFTSPAQVLTWLGVLRSKVADIAAAGRDAAQPPRRRVLSRAEARRQIDEAEEAIGRLMDVAYVGLGETPPSAEHLMPYGEYEGPPSAPRSR